MVRKFLYFIAFMTMLVVAGLLALKYWASQLTEVAFVPKTQFTAPPPLAANVFDEPRMWISRPGIGTSDPSRWQPTGLVEDADASTVAVFFIHPTSFYSRSTWNAAIDDRDTSGRAEIFVRGLASPFNNSVNIWAPRYRQATLGAFLTDAPQARAALDLAYRDVAQAFAAFLAANPGNGPVVLAGHSQGSLHLLRLLRDSVAGKPVAARIVAAYAIGWPVSPVHDLPAMGLVPCTAPDQARCVVSWSSFAEPADPAQLKAAFARSIGLDGQPRGDGPVLCTNPLTGREGGEAPASANLGTLIPDALFKTGKLEPRLVPARCGPDGLLYIGPPPKLGPFVLPGNNFHVYDIPLFWGNLRADFARRSAAWNAGLQTASGAAR